MKGMHVDGQDETTMLWGDLTTAVAYFVITSQLLLFVHDPKVRMYLFGLNLISF